VLNKPFLSYQFDLLRKAGVSDVVLAAGLHNKKWEKMFRKLPHSGVRLHFVYETKPLGTGGAIRHAFDQCPSLFKKSDDPVLILNGDIFMELNVERFLDFHRRKRANVSIALMRVKDPSRFGLVITNKNDLVSRFVEKPDFRLKVNRVNAGAYLFDKQIFSFIPRNRIVSIEKETFPALLKTKMVVTGCPIFGYWNDIGTPNTYLKAHIDLSHKNRHWTGTKYLRKRSDPPQVFIDNSAKILKKVQLAGVVAIGPRVLVSQGTSLKNSIIMEGTRIGRDCIIERAIIGRYCQIEDHVSVKPGAVIGEKTVVKSYSKI